MSVMTFRTKIILLTIAVITAIATVFAAMYKPKRSNTIVRPIIKIAAELAEIEKRTGKTKADVTT